MATLDVTGVAYFEAQADSVITVSDGDGGTDTFTASAGVRYGVPFEATSITVSAADLKFNCETRYEVSQQAKNGLAAGPGMALVVNEVRTSV